MGHRLICPEKIRLGGKRWGSLRSRNASFDGGKAMWRRNRTREIRPREGLSLDQWRLSIAFQNRWHRADSTLALPLHSRDVSTKSR